MENNEFNLLFEHPFINSLVSIKKFKNLKSFNRFYIIPYRYKKLNEYWMVEIYLHSFNEIINFDYNQYHYSEKLLENIHDQISFLNGNKRIKGMKNDLIFIQVRENNENKNWFCLWDIIINKSYFGFNFSPNIISLFIKNHLLFEIKINNQKCKTPIVLYYNLDKKYFDYFIKHKSIFYCNDHYEPFIKLHSYKKNDNIRFLCFIDENLYEERNPIIINNSTWLFYDENNIFSTILLN